MMKNNLIFTNKYAADADIVLECNDFESRQRWKLCQQK